MKKITLLILLLLAFDFGYGQTTLVPGDIAITGFNTVNPDEFSFVLLRDVDNGTEIKFTDKGWDNLGFFRTSGAEGVITWTATTYLACGTEVVISDIGSNGPFSSTIGTVNESENGFALAGPGVTSDQLIVFQGTLLAPTLLYAIQFRGSTGWTNATDNFTSGIPTGLTDGVNAIYYPNINNGSYNCTSTSGSALILADVIDDNNWYLTTSQTVAARAVLGTCTYTCPSCATTTIWTGSWSNGLPNDLTKNVIISNDYNTTAFNIMGCSLTVDSGATLTIGNGSFVEIQNDVTIDGTLVVETQGNFVQRDDAGTFTNNGTSSVDKTTASKQAWYFYTYWSSPVIGETTSNVFPDVDGDRRFWFDAANFVDTDGDDIDDNADDWQYALASNGTDNMLPGVGYAVTEARLFMAPGTGSATFEGEFNTGDVSTNIDLNASNTGTNWNLIGNPYPSAIDFDAFYTANSSVLGGTAYFWSQATPPSEANLGNENSNFSRNDYAMYAAGSGGITGTGTQGASGIIPSQYIPSGQGFFIAGLTTGTATFTNAMRMADATSNTLFFKNTNSKKNSNNIANRLWVNLTSDNGVFNQILVAYVDGATNGLDSGAYDAKRFLTPDFNATLYSTIEENDNNKFAIQGKAPESLTEDEIINLGFSTNIDVATIYKLSIAQFEGDFLTNNLVYVKDNLLDTLHDLSASDYTFTSEVGEFNDRFEIRFSANVLATERVEADSNDLKIIELEDNNIQFTASKNIKTVKIFDLMGRQLYQFEGNQTSETYKLSNLSSSIYIAKVTLINGATITKKAFKK